MQIQPNDNRRRTMQKLINQSARALALALDAFGHWLADGPLSRALVQVAIATETKR
jgi:hypothetical protein